MECCVITKLAGSFREKVVNYTAMRGETREIPNSSHQKRDTKGFIRMDTREVYY
jgi:hypothetical protein